MRASGMSWILLCLPLATGFVVGPASPRTRQTGPLAVCGVACDSADIDDGPLGAGAAGEVKRPPVLLAITGATCTAAGIVARVSGVSSTTSLGGERVVGLGGFALPRQVS